MDGVEGRLSSDQCIKLSSDSSLFESWPLPSGCLFRHETFLHIASFHLGVKIGASDYNAGDIVTRWRVDILLVASCYGNQS